MVIVVYIVLTMEYKLLEKDINGKTIDCKVFLEKSMLDKGTMEQIKKMVYHPSIVNEKIRIMPDCHRGSGCCVGFTYTLGDKVVPQHIGGDIGCGMLCYKLDKQDLLEDFSLEQIDKLIRKVVPMGNADNAKSVIYDEDLIALCKDASSEALEFAIAYKKKFATDIKKYIPEYSIEWLKNKCLKIGTDYNMFLRSISSLGGGNHFIEIVTNEKNEYYLTIHCGSRALGMSICKYHQDKINDTKYFDTDYFDAQMKLIKRRCKDVKQLKIESDKLAQEINDGRHTDYLEGDEAYEYYFDMIFCQKLAILNRKTILQQILIELGMTYNKDISIESIHNYIDFNGFIVRKGAIYAGSGTKCIVALNMRDGILLCEGKGNDDWNQSSAHGAGRIMCRDHAYHKVKMKDFIETMKGVYSTSISVETLDESPFVYKSTDMIKGALDDSLTILEHLKPIINIKANN
jgi:tRNA-splicing ligase RtcB